MIILGLIKRLGLNRNFGLIFFFGLPAIYIYIGRTCVRTALAGGIGRLGTGYCSFAERVYASKFGWHMIVHGLGHPPFDFHGVR